MAKDVSIAFKASDNLTHSIQSMRKSVDNLSRDVSEYRKIQSQAFDKKTEIKFDISQAKNELKELSKLVKEGAEGSEQAFKEKQRALEDLQEEYKRLTKVAQDASKAERSLQDDLNKSNNVSNTMIAQQSSVLQNLAGAGLGGMMGSSLTGSLNQTLGSMYGSETGSAIANVAGGVLSGAAIGAIAGPIGSAVGAAVGGLAGAINAMTEQQQKDDDRFSNEVESIYNKVTNQEGLESGIDLASQREQMIMGFGTLLGDKAAGNKLYQDIKQFGIDTPYDGLSMAKSAEQMLAYGVEAENIMRDMAMLGEVAMGDQNKFNSLSYAYAQTQSAGKLTGQDLMQYTAAGFNPLSVLAEEQGKTLAEMREEMSDGLISSEDVSRAFQIATQEGGQFFGAMDAQMQTYAGTLAMLQDMHAEVNMGYGEGYNAKRKEGMEHEIEQMEGALGQQLTEANRLIGEYEADLENKYQQMITDSITGAMDTVAYKEAELVGDGAAMGKIIAEARANAEIEYKNSDEMLLKYEAERSLVQDIQSALIQNGDYLDFGKAMAEQFSKGYVGVIEDLKNSGALSPEKMDEVIDEHGSWTQQSANMPKVPNYSSQAYNPNYRTPTGWATGLERVPYNNMPAYLHEGERVLTKVEADQMDRGSGGINIAKLADSIVIREEADIDKIINGLYTELKKQALNSA